jgi:D-alanyl-D-alanine carboxypeptidase
MMTLLVVLKYVKKYSLDIENTYIKTSNICAHIIGTTACLKHKDEVKIIDLLYGLMLPSGNDAAGVLAEGIATLMYLEECGEPI